jgi:hypothetical protein
MMVSIEEVEKERARGGHWSSSLHDRDGISSTSPPFFFSQHLLFEVLAQYSNKNH